MDALIGGESLDLRSFLELAGEFGLKSRVPDIEADARLILVLRLVDVETNVPVDLSMSYTPFELGAIDAAEDLLVSGVTLRVARPEDLIIMKAIAHRLHDLSDMKQLLDHYPTVDFKRLEYWIRQYGEALDEPDLWDRIEPLLRDVK